MSHWTDCCAGSDCRLGYRLTRPLFIQPTYPVWHGDFSPQVQHPQTLLQTGFRGRLPLPRMAGARLQLPSVDIFQVVRHRVHQTHGQPVERRFPT